jgi:hypothetical protein
MESGPMADSATPSDNKKAIFQNSLKKNKWLPLQVSKAVIESQSLPEPAIAMSHTSLFASRGRYLPCRHSCFASEEGSQTLGVWDLS